MNLCVCVEGRGCHTHTLNHAFTNFYFTLPSLLKPTQEHRKQRDGRFVFGVWWMGVQSGAWHVYVSAARDATLADHGRGNTFQKVKSERRVKPKKSKRERSQQAAGSNLSTDTSNLKGKHLLPLPLMSPWSRRSTALYSSDAAPRPTVQHRSLTLTDEL